MAPSGICANDSSSFSPTCVFHDLFGLSSTAHQCGTPYPSSACKPSTKPSPHQFPNPRAWDVPQESPDPLLMSSAPVRVLCVLPGPFPLLFPSLPWGSFTFQGCHAVMNCFRGSSPLSECRSRSLLRGPECSRQLSSFCLLVRFSLV